MTAADFVPDGADLDQLRAAAKTCKGCHLWEGATQTVFSRGGSAARVVMVGEQPGDVDLDPDDLYITNAVKHFKFRRMGKRRIHQTPDRIEITACRPWLLAEFAQLAPRVVVVLGATAAQALLGPSFRVTKQRGQLLPWPESAWHAEDFAQPGGTAKVLATLHPSAILRADDRETAYKGLVADLQVVASALG